MQEPSALSSQSCQASDCHCIKMFHRLDQICELQWQSEERQMWLPMAGDSCTGRSNLRYIGRIYDFRRYLILIARCAVAYKKVQISSFRTNLMIVRRLILHKTVSVLHFESTFLLHFTIVKCRLIYAQRDSNPRPLCPNGGCNTCCASLFFGCHFYFLFHVFILRESEPNAAAIR